jgi:hypothetical protein
MPMKVAQFLHVNNVNTVRVLNAYCGRDQSFGHRSSKTEALGRAGDEAGLWVQLC